MQIITHKFFPLGAICYRLEDETIAFVSPNENSLDNWSLWCTGEDMKDKHINEFLDECCEGEHQNLGSGFCNNWIDTMQLLKDFSK